jgi:class 3 adenylate cyclase/tetratricopeptide (TPR) repeat protein
MATCAGCGAGDQPERARFCNECGSPMAVPVCIACNAELMPSARFCNECGAPQGAASPASPVITQPVAARRVTSVLFGDLVGFTSLSERRDQEEVRELLTRYFDECRRIIGRYGGTVEKFIGDAVMAVWGVPTAYEDDAERSVRAGLELVNAVTAMGEDVGVEGLAMRVGIVTGEVAVTVGAEQQGMVAGDAVNTASRVQSAASPGQVWVDETTRLLTSSAITYVDVGSHELKGKADPMPLWSVRAVVAARGGAQRADGLEAPLVGRDRELRLVKELFHATEESGRPALVVVDGEAGVGKSRLAWEFEKYVDGLSTSVRWHSGRCLAYGEGVAYYALAEALRVRLRVGLSHDTDDDADDPDAETDAEDLLGAGLAACVPDVQEREWLRPRLAALLGIGAVGTFAREDLYSAWTTFLERVGEGREAVVLMIDDAQHADDGLLQFVEHLLAVGTFPCFLMLMTRPGLIDDNPVLATNRRATVLHLPTLSDTDMSALLDGLVAGLPEQVRGRLVQRAEGVPLFAVETVRSLIDRDLVVPRGGQYVLADVASLDLDAVGAPASLQALVSARLDTLSPEQRRVVDRASVLGTSFRRDDIVALCPEVGSVDAVLGELQRNQILSLESSRLSAEHGQYRFVQAVVRQVAQATLSRRDRKATHLAVTSLLVVEQETVEELAPIIAQHYLDAIEAVPGADDVAELQLLAVGQLGRAAARATSLGSLQEAAGHLEVALANVDDAATRARLRSELAQALFGAGEYEAAVRHAEAAVEGFDALGDAVGAGLAAARLGLTVVRGLGDPDRARTLVEPRWEELKGRRDADLTMLALAETMVTCYLWLSLDPSHLIEERMRLALRVGDDAALADSLNALALHYQDIGLPPVARILLQASADLARNARQGFELARALVNLTSAMAEVSHDLALAPAREALECATQLGDNLMLSHARVGLAQVQLHRGVWSEVDQLLAEEYRDPVTLVGSSLLRWVVCDARGLAWEPPWERDDPQFETLASVEWRKEAVLAIIMQNEGDLPGAIDVALQGLDRSREATGLGENFEVAWRLAADMVLESGDAAASARLLAMVTTDDLLPVSIEGHRARFCGLWAMRDGDGDGGVEEQLRTAIGCYQRVGSRLLEARVAADLGAWLLQRGGGPDAETLVDLARSTFDEIAAHKWLEEIEESLLTVG